MSPDTGVSGRMENTYPLYELAGRTCFIYGATDTRYKKNSSIVENSSYSNFISTNGDIYP
jgi:hypothetical protein